MTWRFVPLAAFATLALAHSAAAADPLALRYGVAAFGAVDPLREVATVAGCGYDYVEPALSKTVALTPEALASARRAVQASGLHVETMNWFLPGGDIKLTGPAVDSARVRAYLDTSLALAESLGAKVIVFGSPAARTPPEGFPREKAWDQLVDFLRLAAQVIDEHHYGMVIGIEALRRPESSIVNTAAEALSLARQVDRRPVRIIVDFYHLTFENEDPDVLLEARDFIVHLQIADPAQRGFPKDDRAEPRYRRFFENLRTIGYHGRISVEAESSSLATDCGPTLSFLKRMAAPAAR
jgi:D-psicose/D-tagatose/L-ribulose 3-epimerase